MLAIDDLVAAPSAADIRAEWVSRLVGLGIPADKWRPAGALSVALTAGSVIFAGFCALIAAAAQSRFLDFATGQWLTLAAWYDFGVARVEATFATGQVQLTNTGGTLTSFPAGGFQVQNPATGKVYANTSPFTLNPGSPASPTVLTIDIQALELGAASSSVAGSITKLVTTISLVTVTNPTDVIGTDAEDDATLIQRCRDKQGTLSGKGPSSAYRYAVLSATRPDGSPVDINRVAKTADPTTGIVTLYAASPSGAPTAADLSYADANVEALARVDTDRYDLFAATPVALTSTITVWAKTTPGLNAADLTADIEAALDAAVKSYPIGGIPQPPSTAGFLYASFIDGAIRAVNPAIFAVTGTTDLPLSTGQVATLAATITVRFVEASS